MNGFNGEFLRGALDVAPDGVVICEAGGDRLVVYANPAFCRLTGYDVGELVGKNLRLLQGDDRDQPELETLRDALRHCEGARALLRNSRKDGTVFVNEMQISPLKDAHGKSRTSSVITAKAARARSRTPKPREFAGCRTGCAKTGSPVWPHASTSRTC